MALVTGIMPLPPVAITAGIVALVRARTRKTGGKGMAIAGIILGVLWTLIISLVIIAGVNGAFSPAGLGRVADAPSTEVGTCLAEDTAGWSVADCVSPHDAEVYFAPRLEDPGWPGADAVDTRADDLCYEAFEGYVGRSYFASDYEYAFFRPDREEWERGEHRVVCVIVPGYDQLVGSVKGSRN